MYKLMCAFLWMPIVAAAEQYPDTRRVDQVDVYHGVEVADPYRWLEEDVRVSPDVADWVRRQNEVTFAYLESLPERAAIEERLTELWNVERFGVPQKVGGQYVYTKNDGLQNQSTLYIADSFDTDGEVLLDPNSWSEDGTVALGGTSFSEHGRYLAYAVASAGSDWRTWRVMEVSTRRILDDEVEWSKYSRSVSWTKDERGFFYARYEEPSSDDQFQGLTLNQKIFYHRVGTGQAEDVLVYQRPDEPSWGFGTDVTEDGRFLIISARVGTDDRYRVLYRDLTEPYGVALDLINNFDHDYSFAGSRGTNFYFKTSLDAPNKRLIAIDIANPARENWKEIIPEKDEPLLWVSIVNNQLVAEYLRDAVTKVSIYTLNGRPVRDVEFSKIGSAYGFSGKPSDAETFYSFSSYATPPSVYRYDMKTGESKLLRRASVDFDPDDYEVKQIFYKSKDGTRIPMFITHKKNIQLDGGNPTLLYGYGGFNISLTPRYSPARIAWMERGGVYAVANLRGGGEYGENWHQAGTKLNKQNVFDDFIAAAEYLIEKGYAASDTLAIQGGSNGGLLVGAVMNQRPELFGAALAAVGVMDMLRFHRFTAGRYWIDDFGSPDDPEEFKALYAYSPYHNIREGVEYPPTLITTADHDDRVVPGHSFKYTAALQRAQAGDGPTLIRIETDAGHGAGKPTSKRIQEIADQYAFVLHHLD
jgi:prolyl oligopeptidase